jgi:hypothetical protein
MTYWFLKFFFVAPLDERLFFFFSFFYPVNFQMLRKKKREERKKTGRREKLFIFIASLTRSDIKKKMVKNIEFMFFFSNSLFSDRWIYKNRRCLIIQ